MMTIVQVKEKMKRFIPQFLENTKIDVDKMKKAIEAKEFDELHKVAHSMKGYGKPFGFVHLGDYAANIQQKAEKNDLEGVIEHFKQLEAYIENVQIEYI